MEIRTLRQLALTVRARRAELGLSQADLADRAQVSRQWVNEFEGGKATAELGLTLRLLDALDLRLRLTPAERTAPTPDDSDDMDLATLISDLLGEPRG